MTLTFSLSQETKNKITEHSKALGVSASAYIAMAVSNQIKADDLMSNLPNLYTSLNELKDSVNDLAKKQ